MAHFERASLIAGELVAGMALANLERGSEARDSRALDLRTIERMFGAHDPSLGVDPRARLAAAIDQLALHALLGFISRGDVTTTGFIWTRDFETAFRRADWVERSSDARALEERIAARYGSRYHSLVPDRGQARGSEPTPATGGR